MNITKHKTTDTPSTNNTLTEDADFTFDLPANFDGNVYFDGFITGNSTGGFKWELELPDGAESSFVMTLERINVSSAPIQVVTSGSSIGAPSAKLRGTGWITTGENGGTCKFLWAQNTTNATATVLDASSTMTIVGE